MTDFTDALVSAKFVLAGALHAAVLAFAYGKPFAYFDSGVVDVPLKWADFAASINMPLKFVQTAGAGADSFRLHSRQLWMPRLIDLLACVHFRPPMRLSRKVEAATESWVNPALMPAARVCSSLIGTWPTGEGVRHIELLDRTSEYVVSGLIEQCADLEHTPLRPCVIFANSGCYMTYA